MPKCCVHCILSLFFLKLMSNSFLCVCEKGDRFSGICEYLAVYCLNVVPKVSVSLKILLQCRSKSNGDFVII